MAGRVATAVLALWLVALTLGGLGLQPLAGLPVVGDIGGGGGSMPPALPPRVRSAVARNATVAPALSSALGTPGAGTPVTTPRRTGTGPSTTTPRKPRTTPGQAKTSPSTAAPGQTGTGPSTAAPGQAKTSPSTAAPGQTGTSPSTAAPGQAKTSPSAAAPGQTGTVPGQTKAQPSPPSTVPKAKAKATGAAPTPPIS